MSDTEELRRRLAVALDQNDALERSHADLARRLAKAVVKNMILFDALCEITKLGDVQADEAGAIARAAIEKSK